MTRVQAENYGGNNQEMPLAEALQQRALNLIGRGERPDTVDNGQTGKLTSHPGLRGSHGIHMTSGRTTHTRIESADEEYATGVVRLADELRRKDGNKVHQGWDRVVTTITIDPLAGTITGTYHYYTLRRSGSEYRLRHEEPLAGEQLELATRQILDNLDWAVNNHEQLHQQYPYSDLYNHHRAVYEHAMTNS